MTVTWIDQPDHRAWLRLQTRLQLHFARRFPHPDGGAWYLDDDGRPDEALPVHTWISARMLHVYSLGHLAGIPGCAPLAGRALDGLRGPLRDPVHGGWFASVGPGTERDDAKVGYAHAFVVFASASATVAGVPGARDVLDEALEVLDSRFWEEGPGLHRDSAVADWSVFSDYRGINANMHGVEALLSASDATGDARWRERAARVTETVLGWAAGNDWRIPEHFDAHWTPMMEHHRDEPNHPFEPYGATVGHGLEWSRLAVQVAASGVGRAGLLADGAVRLFDRAVSDGWAVDGADGFVYTTDWSGTPVVRQRMHWVVAEAISAAAALGAHTADPRYDGWYRTWWDYAATHLIADNGSWRHELDPQNRPAATVWPGRPDLYHSVHATMLPRLPLAPTAPTALARGLLR
ncbi:N-acylglucosamine 2-epimerase [Humibacillus sp. DSM 29435]|uniref:AGE family epimerase/isomerase n=1 Tax=Humibacillus sp. DSM 29435 TaxID=1869167 RepID=UPI0008734D0B|nr:AGE family epimerase/isomerase [Humibacillus sp. DSM 29435]OFE15999.1 N-acylglucosamine 2-epimerase [Humibacillus sp. DSM 29435]